MSQSPERPDILRRTSDSSPATRTDGGGAASARLTAAPPQAVVVGLCAHGLATVRALASGGVDVIALEADPTLPGMSTRKASISNLAPMNGAGLSQTLLRLASERRWASRPVLFVMNDNMVRDVAEHWSDIAPHYALSWSESRDAMLRLMNKDNLPDFCRRAGVRFPATASYGGPADQSAVAEQMTFPAIVKPAWPMGSFKAVIVERLEEIEVLAQKHAGSLPFVVQQWIPGGPTSLCFANMYLRNGRVLTRFEGRKAYAGVDGLGQGTVMEPWADDVVHATALKFVENLNLSGQVAVEFKRDPAGQLWLIEPNVGRTEYCVDLCIANGVNLPLIEYRDAIGADVGEVRQGNSRIWFDTDRDTGSWLRFVRQRGFDRRALRPAFPYLRAGDLGPFVAAFARKVRRRLGAA